MCVDNGMCVYTDNVCVYRRVMACVCVDNDKSVYMGIMVCVCVCVLGDNGMCACMDNGVCVCVRIIARVDDDVRACG